MMRRNVSGGIDAPGSALLTREEGRPSGEVGLRVCDAIDPTPCARSFRTPEPSVERAHSRAVELAAWTDECAARRGPQLAARKGGGNGENTCMDDLLGRRGVSSLAVEMPSRWVGGPRIR